jgi:hypothetical protein
MHAQDFTSNASGASRALADHRCARDPHALHSSSTPRAYSLGERWIIGPRLRAGDILPKGTVAMLGSKWTYACLLIASASVACTVVETNTPTADAGANNDVSSSSPDADAASSTTDADASSPDDAEAATAEADVATADAEAGSDESSADAGADVFAEAGGDAQDEPSADALVEAGPGGDGGLVLGGDGGNADGAFQLKTPVGSNLLSSSDVHPTCDTVAGAASSTFVMTCRETNGSGQACRTVTVVFSGTPTSGRVYPAVVKTSPGDGEAVVAYQESADCTTGTTNGWTLAGATGNFTVDVFGDTGFDFTLHDVPMGPAPLAAGVTNQNAMGTFTLAGSGVSSFPF